MTNTALDKSLWSFLPTLKKNTLYATWIDVTAPWVSQGVTTSLDMFVMNE